MMTGRPLPEDVFSKIDKVCEIWDGSTHASFYRYSRSCIEGYNKSHGCAVGVYGRGRCQ